MASELQAWSSLRELGHAPDPEAGPAFQAGAMLMSALIERSRGHR